MIDRRWAIAAAVCAALALGSLAFYLLKGGGDPSQPTAAVEPGNSPVYRASGEPIEGEQSALPLHHP